MNCADYQPILDAYIDGELDHVNMLAIERHLSSCGDCDKQIRQSKSIRLALQNPALSFAAPASLRAKISEAAHPPSREKPRRRWFSLPSFSFGAVCAAAVVLLFSLASFPENRNVTNQLVDAHIRSLMADHLTDVQSTDSHTVKPWFAGKIDFTAPVKDLTSEGFPLIGGRLDYLQNRAVIALVYKRNQHTINVFIWPTNPKSQPSSTSHSERGFSIATQNTNGLQFQAISDLNAPELQELLSLLCR